jgi:uncharacterized membrane protein
MTEGTKDLGKTSMGMEANLAALLACVFGWITGLIFFLLEKENKFVRFYALQSILISVVFFVFSIVLMFVPIVNVIAIPVLSIGGVIIWIVCMIKAYQGEKFKLPVIGDMAEKSA